MSVAGENLVRNRERAAVRAQGYLLFEHRGGNG